MKAWSSLTFELLAAAAVLVGAAIVAYFKLRRRKDPAEVERLRREGLNRIGRITSGEIVGLVEPEEAGSTAVLLLYRYDVAGVTYEVAQDVAALPQWAERARHAVGQSTTVKYEPKHPGNSLIVCESWCGIEGMRAGEGDDNPPAAAETLEKP